MSSQTTSQPSAPAGQKALLWISWIGGLLALVLGLTVTDGATKITLIAIGAAVLLVAIVVTIVAFVRKNRPAS